MKRIYLDNNATTFLDPRVAEAIRDVLSQPVGNPSSPHAFGQAMKSLLSEARRGVAEYLKVKQDQIVFTSGGSEGAVLALQGLFLSKQPGHIITSNIEHACVYEILERLRNDGAEVSYLPTGLKGAINVEDVAKAIRPETKLITIMGANNETGVINDIEAIAKLAEQHSIPFVVDGVALLGKENFSLPRGVTAMFFSGHKIHAPQGVGFVMSKKKLKSHILGGSQEFGMRGGTENMLGIVGLAKAISLLRSEQPARIAHMRRLRDHFEQALLKLPGVRVNGTSLRVSNTSNLAFEGIDGETLLIALDQAGVAASLGSACSSGAIETSRVLLQMGIPLARARSSLRFSFSSLNTMEEVEAAIAIITQTIIPAAF
jgi:cysteine desulfurase